MRLKNECITLAHFQISYECRFTMNEEAHFDKSR